MARQAPHEGRIPLLGAWVAPVETGSRTLKDATSGAMRDWVTKVRATYCCVGSATRPYPALVARLQRMISDEMRVQCQAPVGRLPDGIIACVGGGSTSIGAFKSVPRSTTPASILAHTVHALP